MIGDTRRKETAGAGTSSKAQNAEEAKDGEYERKFEINTIADLQRLSFTEIKNLPLNKCKGDVFEAALR
jgi:hypothetical protein